MLRRITVTEATSLRDGLRLLNETGLQILLVADAEGRLTGVLTDGDVRRSLLRDTSLDVPLSRIMNKTFTTLGEDQAHLAQDLIRRAKFNHVPILSVDGKVTDLVMGSGVVARESEKRDIPVVVMAGGQGTRLSPLTRIVPKPLMPVGEQTMLEKIMDTFAAHGFRDFRVIVNYKRDLIKSYFAEAGSPYELQFLDEERPLGTAGGLALLNGRINGTFVLTNCDIVAELQYSGLIDWHRDYGAHLTILGVHKRVDIPYGVIKVDEHSLVSGIEEKPTYNHVIVSGVYVVDSSVLNLIPPEEPLGMDGLIRMLIERGMRVTCYPIESGWFDMGQFEEYRKLLKHFDVFDV
jgi:dTDP-glucose pyrophosphorylase